MNRKNNMHKLINKIRKDFPILKTIVNNQPLVYLDNAATSQKPLSVINAITNYYTNYNANINRGTHYLSDLATSAFEAAREKVRAFINANSIKECIFTKSTTEAINLIATSFGETFLQPGDEIILSTMEHHSNIVPWQLLQDRKNIQLKIIPILNNGELDLISFNKLVTSKTKLVSIVHVSNTLGTINPVKQIIQIAHKHNIPVLLDGAQAIAHLPINVTDLNCDFYVFSGHKIFGPTGIGVLYGKEQYLNQMQPYQGGGQMILKVSFAETIYNQLPYKFEAGTQPIAEVIGLGAAIDYINQLDWVALQQHEQQLLVYATQKLQTIPGLTIIGNATNKTSILSFTLDQIHPHDIGTILNTFGIAIRVGHLCTLPIMDFYNIPALSRASFSIYNTYEEIDKLYNALLIAKKIFKK
ncbi:MAG: cysteine desulfurase [Gammaproteobacteria bacterium]